jgi:hypothetical protein
MDNLVIRKALQEDLAAILALYADLGDILDVSQPNVFSNGCSVTRIMLSMLWQTNDAVCNGAM